MQIQRNMQIEDVKSSSSMLLYSFFGGTGGIELDIIPYVKKISTGSKERVIA
jgi:hypothetical protein